MAIHNKALAQGNNTDYGHKNLVINGDFSIWQRGTSFSNPTGVNDSFYSADRWCFVRGGFSTGITVSSISNFATGIPNGVRIARTSGDTNTSAAFSFGTTFERGNVAKIAGRTVTFQCKVRKGANYSATGNLLTVRVSYGTANTDSTVNITGFGGTEVTLTSQSIALTATAQLVTATFTVPSTANQLGIYFNYSPTGTAGANDYFEIADVQLEYGSIATSIERRPLGLELMLCQRYYEIGPAYFINNGAVGVVNGTVISYKVSKRAVPTIVLGTPVENVGVTGTMNTSPVTTEGFRLWTGSTASGSNYYTNTWAAIAELY